MIGFPTETYEEASATIEFAIRSSLHRAMFVHVIPFAGTELAEMAKDKLLTKNGINDPQEMSYFTTSLNISAMSDSELHSVFRRANMLFYLNPQKILRLVIRHPNVLSLPYYAFLTLIKILPLRNNSA
jgi:radical SAM superfamily enzyme YgiQ (UPF0313 family)